MADLKKRIEELAGDKAKEILALVEQANPMKRYLATDKGKAAKKRANQKYYDAKGRLQKGDSRDVALFLQEWCIDRINDRPGIRALSDDDIQDASKFDPFHTITATQLWHDYQETSGMPGMTRKRFISFLPELAKVSAWTDAEGKKHYSEALKIDIVTLGWLKEA